VNYLDKFFTSSSTYFPANGEAVHLTIGGLNANDFYTTVSAGFFDGLPCPNPGEPAGLIISAGNVVTTVYSDLTGAPEQFGQTISASACGTVPTYNLDANGFTVFEHIANTVQDADYRYFGRLRQHLDVRLEQSNADSNSYYSRSEDAIHLLVKHVSGDFGAFTQAHEWGHAFLEKAFAHNDQGARFSTDACKNHSVGARRIRTARIPKASLTITRS